MLGRRDLGGRRRDRDFGALGYVSQPCVGEMDWSERGEMGGLRGMEEGQRVFADK